MCVKDKATPRPWAVHKDFPVCVIPLTDIDKKIGAAVSPDAEFLQYAKQIACFCNHVSEPRFYRSRVQPDESMANARLIVRAVNSHEALVAALRSARRALLAALEQVAMSGIEFDASETKVLNVIDAALELAGEV